MPPRVAIIASKPIQHFCPLYRCIGTSGGVHLQVFFASSAGLQPFFDQDFGLSVQWQPGLVDGFDHEFLCGIDGEDASNTHQIRTRLFSRLVQFNPDIVVVYGYAHPVSRAAIWWTKHLGKKLIYISDSERRSKSTRWKLLLKRIALPRILSKVDAFLTVGDCNEAYYSYYGADSFRFFRSPFSVDEDRFRAAIQQRDKLRMEVRQRYRIPEDALVAITVSKLTPNKRIEDAVRAVCSLWKNGLQDRVFLLVAGDGSNRTSCEAIARAMSPDAVRFVGFVPVTELPAHYVASDVLLHPSCIDAHPLAISEAVFCGLPCIVSDRVGSVGPTDDMRPEINGWEFPVGDFAALAHRLSQFASQPDLLRAMSDQSSFIARQRSMDRSLAGFLHAVQFVSPAP